MSAPDGMRRISLADLKLHQAAEGTDGEPDEQVQVCPTCGGAGYWKMPVPCGHPQFGQLHDCECRQTEHAQRQRKEQLKISGLLALSTKTFSTYSPFAPGVGDAYRHAVAYSKEPQGWLCLMGGVGCGKTHLAAAIGHVALAARIGVIFKVVPDLLDHLRTTFRPDSAIDYDASFELIREVPLLVLDDLGTESRTEWAREKLFQILNHRYNYALPTVITSNVEPKHMDARIYSRMCDRSVSQLVEVKAADYRRREEGV